MRFLFILMLVAGRVEAATYYVNSSTGNDANNGSFGAPWATLAHSMDSLVAGDTLFCTGTFQEIHACHSTGTSTSPITIDGHNATFIVSGNGDSGAGNQWMYGSYLIFNGWTVNGANPVSYGGWLNFIGGTGNVVENCQLFNIQGDYASASGGDHCFLIVSGGDGNTPANSCMFSNLFFHDVFDSDLFRIWGQGNLITHCVMSNCLNAHYDYGGVVQDHADLVQCWGGGSFNNVVDSCLFISNSCSGGIINTDDGSSGPPSTTRNWTYRNNIFVGNGSQNIQVYSPFFHCYNNVFYNWYTAIFLVGQGAYDWSGNGLFFNNAFIGSGLQDYAGVTTKDYNGWDAAAQSQAGNPPASANLSHGYGPNNFIVTNPGFVNAAGGDFHLTASSPLRGMGTNMWNDPFASNSDKDGNSRPVAGPWDVGPYQFGGAANTNPITQPAVNNLVFSPVALTNTYHTLTFSVANTGSGVLTGTVYGASAPFSLVGGTNYSLVNNQSASFTVLFNPTSSNTFSSSVNFNDNGGGSNFTVNLSGQANVLLASPFQALSGTLNNNWTTNGSSVYQAFDTATIGASGQAIAYYWFSVGATTNYTITASALAPTESQNSFWINVDNPPVDPSCVWDIEPAIPVTTNVLVSLRGTGTSGTNQFRPNYWLLTAGPHLLTLYGRENGAQVSQFTINGPSAGLAPTLSGPSSITNDVLSGFSMSVSVTGTTPIFFQWTSNAVNLVNQTNPSFSNFPSTATTNTYGCIATNAFGSVTNTAFGVLTNGTVPAFVIALLGNYSNSTNGGINLSAKLIGTLPIGYYWQTNSVTIANAIGPSYVQVPALAQTNQYFLFATNAYGQVNQSTVVHITNGVLAAVITNQPQAVTNLRIRGFTLTVGVDGTPPLFFQWQQNSNNIASQTSQTLLNRFATTNDSGWYRCAVSNAFSGGNVYSTNVYVSMTNGTIPAFTGPTNWTAGTNVGIQMYCNLTAGDSAVGYPITFQWTVLGTNISGATSSNLVLTGVPAQTNTYFVVVKNFEAAVSNSAVAKITNLASGNPPSITLQPLGTTNQTGTAACYFMTLSATGDIPIHYSWRKNGTPQPPNSGNNANAIYFCPTTILQSGNWDCVLTNVSGSVTSAVASILFTNAIAPPIAVSSSSQAGTIFTYNLVTVSFSSAGSYSPSGLPLTYSWSFGDGTTSTNANPTHVFGGGFYAVRMSVSDGVNPPVFASDIDLLVVPFQAFGAGGLYLKKLMF